MSTTNTTHSAAAGWYPVDAETERFWDGSAWTEQTRPAPQTTAHTAAQASAADPVAVGAPTAPRGSSMTTGTSKKAWWKRGWVIAVVALLVGIGIGGASAGNTDPKSSQAYKDLESQLTQTNSQLTQTKQAAEQQAADDQAELAKAQGSLPAREAALKKAQAQLKTDQSQLKTDQGTIAAREKSVAARERRVGIVERAVAANTLSGDGMYKVGVDMKAGTYKSSGSTGCYYAVLNSSNTEDISTNNLTDGPAFVTVYPGKYFETQDCADWVLQQ